MPHTSDAVMADYITEYCHFFTVTKLDTIAIGMHSVAYVSRATPRNKNHQIKNLKKHNRRGVAAKPRTNTQPVPNTFGSKRHADCDHGQN